MIKTQLLLKYFFDFIIALFLLIILSPLLIICSLIILLFNGRPIFFIQERPGLNEKIFKIYKFRTMDIVKNGNTLPDHQRMTQLGRLLRKTSIDELPQLFNVLRGELSLVGPRPLLVEYLPLYTHRQKKRHQMKPGITGWAQVNGRNTISWEEKFEYDIWYIENWSLMLDFKIILLTILKVFKPSGINASDSVTMEKFKGSNYHA